MRINSTRLVAIIAAILQKPHNLVDSSLKHLQRHRLLEAAGGGRGQGHPCEFGPAEIVTLCVAFELMETGITPKRASQAIEQSGTGMLDAMAAVMANRARADILLALDGSLTSCSPEIIVQWARSRGSTRSAVLVNMARLVDDLRNAVADAIGREAAPILEALDAWAADIVITRGNAS